MYLFDLATAQLSALFSFLLTYLYMYLRKRGIRDELVMSLEEFFFYQLYVTYTISSNS